ncbi:MAG: class II fructose-bisphosphate aldolase [Candidatus Saccharibacteria bacterium]
MLVHIGKIVNRKMLGRYAVPAFNTNDLETTQGIVRAAVRLKAPVIIQTSMGALEYAGDEELAGLIKAEARKASVPIALHLDHGHDFRIIKRVIDLGFSSVMIDASHLPYKDNVKITKQVVAYAHKRGVWVQAEIGRLLGSEDWQDIKSGQDLMTDPQEAARFAQETRVNTLAIAAGSLHGIPVDPKIKKITSALKEHIDVFRVKAIHQAIPTVPLVIHGASGVPDGQLRAAIRYGVAIYNIDTDLRVAFNNALRDNLKRHPEAYDPRKLLRPATDALQEVAEHKLRVLKTANQSKNIKQTIKTKI